jgi:hypothetical protein
MYGGVQAEISAKTHSVINIFFIENIELERD